MSKLAPDKVFISYSWTTKIHEEWVLDLSKRLVNDGIEVVLDKWDSVEGQNLNVFMEKSVTDPTIKKVLVICDKLYTDKANGYKGGVGTETVIISNEVYKDANQTKFIPIIAEKGPDGQIYMPVYFGTSKYIDLSSDELFEENYEKLIRNLYGKPEHKKPKLGKAPGYLLNDERDEALKSFFALRTFKHQSEKKPNNIDIYFKDFTEILLEDFESFSISPKMPDQIAQQTYNSYSEMIRLRDVYVQFIEYYVRESVKLNSENITDLFEELYPLITKRPNNESQFYEAQFEHMKLFVHEIVLYTGSLLLKYKKYEQFNLFVNNHYIVCDAFGRKTEGSIKLFRSYPRLLEDVQPTTQDERFISYSGFLLKQRATIKNFPFEALVETDFQISLFSYSNFKNERYIWWPITFPYLPSGQLNFVTRLKSRSNFEQFKDLYSVSSGQELKDLLRDFANILNSSSLSYSSFAEFYLETTDMDIISSF